MLYSQPLSARSTSLLDVRGLIVLSFTFDDWPGTVWALRLTVSLLYHKEHIDARPSWNPISFREPYSVLCKPHNLSQVQISLLALLLRASSSFYLFGFELEAS
jgi:hypothetical protein